VLRFFFGTTLVGCTLKGTATGFAGPHRSCSNPEARLVDPGDRNTGQPDTKRTVLFANSE
jgi:hypothetical protein